MADLTISDATHARSAKGMNVLANDIVADIKLVEKKLFGDEYKNFVNEVKKYWVGADADKFLTNFKKGVDEIQKGFKSWEKIVSTKFEEDKTQFAKFQSSNDIMNR
ncbi:MAG: hypothetical protein HFG40_03060 [Bacilli bacterium]|nr:hypothetical protein [Bacilli bacterium]